MSSRTDAPSHTRLCLKHHWCWSMQAWANSWIAACLMACWTAAPPAPCPLPDLTTATPGPTKHHCCCCLPLYVHACTSQVHVTLSETPFSIGVVCTANTLHSVCTPSCLGVCASTFPQGGKFLGHQAGCTCISVSLHLTVSKISIKSAPLYAEHVSYGLCISANVNVHVCASGQV